MRILATHGLLSLPLRRLSHSAPCSFASLSDSFATGVAVALLMGTLALVAMPTGANTLYSISRDDDQLRTISPVDGTTMGTPVTITLFGPIHGGNGLATDPWTADLYALVRIVDGFPPNRWLVIIDPATGTSTVVGNTGEKFAGLAFDSDGTLYAVTGDGGSTPESLYTLSLGDGSSTFIVTLGNGGQGETIGFNSDDGFLYHASGVDDGVAPDTRVFEKIDLDTLAVTNIPLSGYNYGEITALVFSWSANQFLATNNQTLVGAVLMNITNAGAVSFAGSMDHVSKGIAFVPEPASSLMLIAGTGFLVVLNRRRGRRLQ